MNSAGLIAYHEGELPEGTHLRFVVDRERFLSR